MSAATPATAWTGLTLNHEVILISLLLAIVLARMLLHERPQHLEPQAVKSAIPQITEIPLPELSPLSPVLVEAWLPTLCGADQSQIDWCRELVKVQVA